MRTAGIICEYNPFHLGHQWMIEQLRRDGVEAVVCVMSGNFVQRGDAAVTDKLSRAEMALCCGADLVLELPTPWAAATAEQFARGGVAVLERTGVVTQLAFGSECGDAAVLQRLACVLDSEEYTAELRARLSSGESYAVCRQKAVAALAGEAAAQQLACANNNLGVEYCRALRHCGSRMQPVTLQRFGAAHDGAPREGIASATHIRALLYGGQTEEACAYMPAAAAQVLRRELAAGRAPAELKRAERAMLSRLRTMSEADFARYDRAGEGLYHRIYQAVRSGSGVEEILEAAKTRRYSHARLRRLLLCAWLNMPEIPEQVSYLRVLAADQVGRVLLRQMRDQGVPVLTKAADVAQLGDAAEALFYAEAIRTDLYTLTFPDLKQSVCGRDWRITPIMR